MQNGRDFQRWIWPLSLGPPQKKPLGQRDRGAWYSKRADRLYICINRALQSAAVRFTLVAMLGVNNRALVVAAAAKKWRT